MTDLMQPRYKVIADYPDNDLPVGCIIQFDIECAFLLYDGKLHKTDKLPLGLISSYYFSHVVKVKNYPHLFKRLEWWQERSFEEMPKYLKTKAGFGMVREVRKYYSGDMQLSEVIFIDGKARKTGNFIPATEDEYNNFINKK